MEKKIDNQCNFAVIINQNAQIIEMLINQKSINNIFLYKIQIKGTFLKLQNKNNKYLIKFTLI